MRRMNVDLGIWSRLSRVVIFLLLLAGLIGVAVWYRPLIKHNEALRKRIFDLETQVQREEQDNRKLEAAIKAIQTDPRTVERVAREKLNWAKPGETVIRFEEPPRAALPAQTERPASTAPLTLGKTR
jgi:cell division protein FtsB